VPATRSRPAPPAGRGVWRTAASPGGLIGLLGLLTCLVVTAFLLLRVLPGQESSGMRAVLIVFVVVGAAMAATLAYLLYGYFTLVYILDRQQLTIRWGWSRYVIPLASIEFVGPAQQVLEGQRPGASVPWPGYYLEAYPLMEGIGVRTFATQPVHRQVAVCTADLVYALSPERPVRFMEELVRLRERVTQPPPVRRPEGAPVAPAAATQPLPVVGPAPRPPGPRRGPAPAAPPAPTATGAASGRLSAPLGILGDNAARALLGIAAALNLAMLGYIIWRLPLQPDRIPLHFNALGQVDRIGQPREILLLWGVAVGVLVANVLLALSVQRYDSFAARLLLAGPVLTGLVAWVAVVNLL
jgi:hypothetical protein